MTDADNPSRAAILLRGLMKRCPRCGRGRMFGRWYALDRQCADCGLPFEAVEGDTWAFMYFTTAFITGLIVAAMFLIRPAHLWLGRGAVLGAALAAIFGTLPNRKGMAVALDYFF